MSSPRSNARVATQYVVSVGERQLRNPLRWMCLVCATVFQPQSNTQKTCSSTCAVARKHEKAHRATERAAQQRGARKQRSHCRKGHPFDVANTLLHRNAKTGRVVRRCRLCRNVDQQSRYRPRERPTGTRNCAVCGSLFVPYRPLNVACGPACSRARHAAQNKTNAATYRANGKQRQYKQKYLAKPDKREANRGSAREYYRIHKAERAEYSRRNRQKQKRRRLERIADPTSNLRARCAFWSAQRKARIARAAVGDAASVERFFLWARTAPLVRCYWCKRRTAPATRHVDHIIPLAKGGAHVVGNLCVSCRRCNTRKQAKLPEEFCGQAELRMA